MLFKLHIFYRILFVYSLVWIYSVSFMAVIAFPNPVKKYFPEQNLPKPSRLRDGQSLWDKLFIMRMLNLIERQSVANEGISTKAPWIKDYVFEGDIILQRDQAEQILYFNKQRKKRKLDAQVMSTPSIKKWPLPINYIFDGKHTREQREKIRIGIKHWEDNTCISFTNISNSTVKSIKFINDSGCYSFVGNSHGVHEQTISISQQCTRKGIVAHEIGHALGFWHEHARADRDDFLSVIRENITEGQYHNFEKVSWEIINNLEVPYDLGSVMHYNGMQFSKGRKITVRTHNSLHQNTIGQREELSFFDVKLANKAYCNDVCNPNILNGSCLHDGYQDPKNCSRCRCPDGLGGDFCEQVADSSHDCGGHIHLTASSLHTVTSPGFPDIYEGGLKCFWLIQSPNGTAVNIQFQRPYMESQFCDRLQPYLPCEDFVEVRFTDSLGITGGRFCCNDQVQSGTLKLPIVTHSNHALILFKTYAPGRVGFQAKISIESCGGCQNNVTDGQVPCKRKVTKDCYQTWYIRTKLNGCGIHFWGCMTPYIIRPVRRLSKCYSEEAYCCKGYILSSDKQNCTKDPEAVTNEEVEDDDDKDGGKTSDTSNVEEDQGIPSGWTGWTDWSTCSKTCGGCGTQSRSRHCGRSEDCVGDNQETRSCGINVCGHGNVQKPCARTITKSRACGFSGFFFGGTPKTCYSKVTEYYSQTKNCCCGYTVQNDTCQQSDNAPAA